MGGRRQAVAFGIARTGSLADNCPSTGGPHEAILVFGDPLADVAEAANAKVGDEGITTRSPDATDTPYVTALFELTVTTRSDPNARFDQALSIRPRELFVSRSSKADLF